VIKIDGQFTRGEFRHNESAGGGRQDRGGEGGSRPQGEVQGGDADFDVDNPRVHERGPGDR
jgi:hypothetical protein